MTCGECEVRMAAGEISAALEEHLGGCDECRGLWDELQANRHALRAMGLETVPAPATPTRPTLPWWKWSSAAAALVLSAAGAWFASRPPKPPQIVSVDVNVTGVVQHEAPVVKAKIPDRIPALIPVASTEPLKVKMLTPDPDVVIYWLVD